jgi:predicted DCC family thiol-disulfide oxidoreductase YuxK
MNMPRSCAARIHPDKIAFVTVHTCFPKWQVVKVARKARVAIMKLSLTPAVRSPAAEPGTLTVWYDGACPLCTREIALMRRLDRARRIEFVDVASPLQACPVDRRLLLERFHAREGDELLSGAAAFAAMWRAIPLLRPLGQLARLPGMLWLLEQAYRGFLRLRPALRRLLR